MERRTCAACGASIFFAQTERGKRIPIDWDPVDGGNIRLDGQMAVVESKRSRGMAPLDGGPRYTSHFATCPQAADFRTNRKRNP
jgi:hypothetical protein